MQFADAPTISEGYAGSLVAGTSENADCGQRKAIIITNPDAAESLTVYCSSAPYMDGGVLVQEDVVCAVVGPKQSFVIESTDSFLVENSSAVEIPAFYVLETFYHARA